MGWFRDHCAILSRPQAVLHIGAGGGDDIDVYLDLTDSRVHLVEPQPACVERLEGRVADADHIELVQLAAAAASGSQAFHMLSVPRFSGFLPAGAFREQMPGLFETACVEVETAGLADMVGRFGLRPGGDNWLVVDAPGVESLLVEALEASSEAPVFSHVFLTASADGIPEAAEPMPSLAERLGAIGYRQVGANDSEDADWPRSHFELDPIVFDAAHQAAKARKLRETLTRLEAEHKAALARKDEALEAQREEFAGRERAASEALTTATSELESLQAQFRALQEREQSQRESAQELESRWQSLKEEFDLSREAAQTRLRELDEQLAGFRDRHVELEGRSTALQGQNTGLREQLDARTNELSELRQSGAQRLAELTSAVETAQGRARELEREASGLRERMARDEGRIRELESRLDQSHDDLSVALRAQAQRETDLEDLRERYAGLMELKERQQELLQKLHRRLGAASEYLKHISGDGDDRGAATQAARLERALSGDFEPGG